MNRTRFARFVALTAAVIAALAGGVALARTSGDFTAAATSPEAAGTSPHSVAVGDFNRDGSPDLAVANFNSNDVSILLGSRSGDFTAAATSPEAAGAGPLSVVVDDFNRDGSPDLAVANQNSNDVSILLGSRSGDFTPAATSPEAAGAFPFSVAVGDFNRDGSPDLAVANSGSSNVSILLGSRTGDFTAAATSPEAAGAFPARLAVGDFNRDGSHDLAVANFNSNSVSILLGSRSGDFTAAATSPEAAGAGPRSVEVEDFNRDGSADLAVANFFSNDVSILLGG